MIVATIMSAFRNSTWFYHSHGSNTGVELYSGDHPGRYQRSRGSVDVAWRASDGQLWSFSISRKTFVKWVNAGFDLACEDCANQGLLSRCEHLFFPEDLRIKAIKTATAIQMELV